MFIFRDKRQRRHFSCNVLSKIYLSRMSSISISSFCPQTMLDDYQMGPFTEGLAYERIRYRYTRISIRISASPTSIDMKSDILTTKSSTSRNECLQMFAVNRKWSWNKNWHSGQLKLAVSKRPTSFRAVLDQNIYNFLTQLRLNNPWKEWQYA